MIGRRAFQLSGIKSIVLPDVKGIILEGSVFDQCHNLESCTVPDGYDITAASGLFSSCLALQEVVIGEGITTRPSTCFNRCTALRKVILPSTVSSIKENILFGATAMENFMIKAVNPPSISNNDLGYNFSNTCKIYVPDTSVNAYKESSWWTKYSSRIYPMSSLSD